jgi:hypothetical protein
MDLITLYDLKNIKEVPATLQMLHYMDYIICSSWKEDAVNPEVNKLNVSNKLLVKSRVIIELTGLLEPPKINIGRTKFNVYLLMIVGILTESFGEPKPRTVTVRDSYDL